MSGNVGAALALIMVCAVSVAALRVMGFSGAPAVVCLGAVSALSLFSGELSRAIDSLFSFSAGSEATRYLEGALKIIGVGYSSGICQDSCEALGEPSLGRAAALVGRLETVIIAAPFFFEILGMGMDMLS